MEREPGDIPTVLYVNHVGQIGGAENSLLSLVRNLDREHFTPVIALPEGPVSERVAELDVPVNTINSLRLHQTLNPFSALAQYVRLRRMQGQIARVAEQSRASIVHANGLPAVVASVLGSGIGKPVVWHCRDLLIGDWVMRWVGRRCCRIVAVSEVVREALLEATPALRSRLRVIYNGIDPQQFIARRSRREVRAELGVALEAPVVAVVGQLVPWKRHDLFVEAAEIVLRHRPGTRFWVIGEDMYGENAGYVNRLKSSGPGAVTFLGYREDVADLVSAADVIAHPATAEALGRAVLEAMSLGKPVVAARAGGLPELIEHERSGLLVEPGRARPLANAIVSLLADRQLAIRLGEAAQQRVGSSFSTQHMVAETEQLYAEVLQEADNE